MELRLCFFNLILMKNLFFNIRVMLLLRLMTNNLEATGGVLQIKEISIDNYLLSIIIYSDAITCDHLGKTSEHSIYISLGNISNWLRNKSHAKVLVGYLLKLKAKDNITRNSKSL